MVDETAGLSLEELSQSSGIKVPADLQCTSYKFHVISHAGQQISAGQTQIKATHVSSIPLSAYGRQLMVLFRIGWPLHDANGLFMNSLCKATNEMNPREDSSAYLPRRTTKLHQQALAEVVEQMHLTSHRKYVFLLDHGMDTGHVALAR